MSKKKLIGIKPKDRPKRKMSMQDLIHDKPESKGKFFFTTAVEDDEAAIKRLFDEDVLAIHKNEINEYASSIAYNNNINKIHPLYTSFEPNSSYYLIRFFRRVPELRTDSGLILPTNITREDLAVVEVNTFTGHKITGKRVKTNYLFMGKALVVSVPEHEKQITPGTVAYVKKPVMKQETTEYGSFVYYEGWWVHPDSNYSDPVSSVKDPHFGFALYPRSAILGIDKKVRLPIISSDTDSTTKSND